MSMVEAHSQHEQTVSFGLMLYACFFDSDTAVFRPRLDLLDGDGCRCRLTTTDSISGQAQSRVVVVGVYRGPGSLPLACC